MLNIAILGGGTSSEREVSLKSSKKVFENLDQSKYNKEYFDFPSDLEKFLKDYKKFDVVMPVFHGPGGEDGTIQGFLNTLGLKFTFSDVEAHAIAMNKNITKIIMNGIGLLNPKYKMLDYKNIKKHDIEKDFGYPFVAKVNRGGSSIGVEIINNKDEFDEKMQNVIKHKQDVMIEEYISGKEETVAVLGNGNDSVAMPVTEIRPKTEFFDYKAKYDPEFCDEICPAPIEDDLAKELQKQALLVHQTLGCRGISRSDFIVTENNKIYFLEINTIPGMTDASLFPQAAAVSGYDYPKFLDKLIELALE